MPKKKSAARSALDGLAQPRPPSQPGSSARQLGNGEAEALDAEQKRTERMRVMTLALGRNLSQVHWAWVNPTKAYDHVSMPMQQVMTFLALVTLFSIEEMMYDLASDEQATRKIPAWVVPDLKPDEPEGFLANLPRWRKAVAQSRVEAYLEPGGRQIAGLRAWLPPSEDAPAWEMQLDVERLSALVESLVKALPFWGAPPLRVTLPPKER